MAAVRHVGGIAEAKSAEMAADWHGDGIAEATPAEVAADWHGVYGNPADELRGGLLVFPLLRIFWNGFSERLPRKGCEGAKQFRFNAYGFDARMN